MPLPPLTQLQAVVLQPDGSELSIRVFGDVLLEAEGLHLSLLFPMQLALCPVWILYPVWELGEEGLGCWQRLYKGSVDEDAVVEVSGIRLAWQAGPFQAQRLQIILVQPEGPAH